MQEPKELVEHFFRHEYGRVVSILTRSIGMRHLELVEDIVQTAMGRALHSWSHQGLPEDPAGWIFQTARRLAIDALRRERLHGRFVDRETASAKSLRTTEHATIIVDEFGDETLRMLFLACHPAIPIESSIAFALKSVCGFSVNEIGTALMLNKANVQKRLERAKHKIRDFALELESLNHPWMSQRLDRVLNVVYLLFNEGYLGTTAEQCVRMELCGEAIRLGRLLTRVPIARIPETYALLALMCFHSSRFPSRTDDLGYVVLLEHQDRTRWNNGFIHEGLEWFQKAVCGEKISRFHVEAAIAWEHCRAASFAETDWNMILRLYLVLEKLSPGPAQTLNLAIAESKVAGPKKALLRLENALSNLPEQYSMWFTVKGILYKEAGEMEKAIEHLRKALSDCQSSIEADQIRNHIQEIEAASTTPSSPSRLVSFIEYYISQSASSGPDATVSTFENIVDTPDD